MRTWIRLGAFGAAIALLGCPQARAQLLNDLDSISLEYRILSGKDQVPVGTAEVSFERAETERGPRLLVTGRIEFTADREPPLHYVEEAELQCTENGAEKFESRVTIGEKVSEHVGILTGDEFAVTSTQGELKKTYKITAVENRSNFGMFCPGFFGDRGVNGTEPVDDFPLFLPAYATHSPRQIFREGFFPVEYEEGERIRIQRVRMMRQSRRVDRYWFAADEHQMLIRLEEHGDYGRLTYELVAVNGVPTILGDVIR